MLLEVIIGYNNSRLKADIIIYKSKTEFLTGVRIHCVPGDTLDTLKGGSWTLLVHNGVCLDTGLTDTSVHIRVVS